MTDDPTPESEAVGSITITSAGLISPNASVPNGNGIYLDGVTYTTS